MQANVAQSLAGVGLLNHWIAAVCLAWPYWRAYRVEIILIATRAGRNDVETSESDEDGDEEMRKGVKVGAPESLSNSNQHEARCCLSRATHAITTRRVVQPLTLVDNYSLDVDTAVYIVYVNTALNLRINISAAFHRV